MTILYYLYGLRITIIGKFLFLSENTIKRYINKFIEKGVDALDRKCSILRISDNVKLRERIISIIHSPPSQYGINRTSWTIKLLKEVLHKKGTNIGHNTISKIIHKAGYRFWKAKEVLTSNDPNYKEKVNVIMNILMKIGPNDRFFSIDEFGPFAVKERGGRRLVHYNERPVIPQWQRSKGSLIVIGALELSTNQITYFYSTKKDGSAMIQLLKILINKYAGCRYIYLSWDSASWHSSKTLLKEIAFVNKYSFRKKNKTPLVKIAPLPARAQFLNVIESVFSGMVAGIIENSNYQSVDEAKLAIDRYFKERNEHFLRQPKRAGGKIWGKELVAPSFKEGQNCKNPRWR